MSRNKHKGPGSRLAIGMAATALVLGIPTASLAVSLIQDGSSFSALSNFPSFTPADADPAMARMIESRDGASHMMHFTPAGSHNGQDRSVTVAVRVDAGSAQAIPVRNAIAATRDSAMGEAADRIGSTRYNLGLARGYRSFAQAPALSQPLSTAAIPDLAEFEPSPGVRQEPSRFAARIALEEERSAAQPAPQTADALSDQRLDVAGSYRLTRNLDVTAGVRYQQDRNYASQMPNMDQQDSQAVFIGTQFRF